MSVMRRYILLLMVVVLSSFFAETKASHIAAVNITYEGIDTFQYIVTVKVYRDCSSLQFVTNSIKIKFSSQSCGLIDSIFIAIDSSGIGQGVFQELPCSDIDTCDPAITGYSVEEFTYMDTITLPGLCSDWVISYETAGKRNINNVLDDAINKPIFVSALVNNIAAPGNSSPTFEKPPVAIFCIGGDFYFDQGANESDGDSLVYSLSPAQAFNGDTMIYLGYTYLVPFGIDLAVGLNVDSLNGIISFVPDTPALTSVLCVLIQEYDSNGVLIGSIKNDMQVFINDSCAADTLNFVGDTTTATDIHPAISVACLQRVITIHFDHGVQCETIAADGSDFIVQFPALIGGNLPIDSIGTACTGGLVDSLVLYLSDSMRFNGSYLIYDTDGSDGTPILGECGRPLNDTLEVRMRDCVKAFIDLMNVTVVNNTSIDVLWSVTTENFDTNDFISHDVHRSLLPAGPYAKVGATFSFIDTIYSDVNVSVSDTSYNYKAYIILDPKLFLTPVSDSIASILLSAVIDPGGDTTKIDLSWSQYWGWSGPLYYIMESIENGPWDWVAYTSNLSYTYTKPLLASNYRLLIQTTNTLNGLRSRSNWIEFNVPIIEVPNVITPNNDGINDYFFVSEKLMLEPVHLIVYNRWGVKVFEDNDYANNWDGDNMVGKPLNDGTYYYVLILPDAKDRAGFITIIR